MAGSPGALAGAAVGPGIAYGLRAAATELLSRRLTRREHSRVEQVVVVAAETIRRNLDRGEQPRSDWSVPAGGTISDAAEEIAEGVLLAAQREYEERKLSLIGRMLGNMQFHPQLDRGYCNHLLRAAQELSYRQLCLLVLFIPSVRDRYGFVGSPDVGDGMGPVRAVLHEIFELSERSMLQQAHTSGTGTEMVLNATHVVPARTMTVTGPGGWLVILTEAQELIPQADIDDVASILQVPPAC